jgi:hypothetical protein
MYRSLDFTVNDIVSKNEKKNTSRNSIKGIFLDRCRKRIESHNKFGKEDIIFDVPDFIIGIPPYDSNEITRYLLGYLLEAGFHVVKLPKINAIYISWKKDDIEKTRNQKNGFLTLAMDKTGFLDNFPINSKAIN